MSVIAPNPQVQKTIMDGLADLGSRIDTATSTRNSRAAELHALQTWSLSMIPLENIPDLTSSPPVSRAAGSTASIPLSRAPSPATESSFTPHKCLRMSVNDGADGLVDSQCCSADAGGSTVWGASSLLLPHHYLLLSKTSELRGGCVELDRLPECQSVRA